MTYNWIMIKVNVFEVKAKLAEYLDRVAQGERLVICRYNTPVAELRPVQAARAEPRPIGPVAGRPTFDVPSSFFEPMHEDELTAWEGTSPIDPLASTFPAYVPDPASKVAERAPLTTTKKRVRPKGRRA
jgi:prevent-host-death family protein